VPKREWTGAQWPAIHEYRASATLGDPAAELGPGHTENVAQDPKKGRVAVDVDGVIGSIDVNLKGHGKFFPAVLSGIRSSKGEVRYPDSQRLLPLLDSYSAGVRKRE
jgi:hypothetical protein